MFEPPIHDPLTPNQPKYFGLIELLIYTEFKLASAVMNREGSIGYVGRSYKMWKDWWMAESQEGVAEVDRLT
jgi:hypothetical protein